MKQTVRHVINGSLPVINSNTHSLDHRPVLDSFVNKTLWREKCNRDIPQYIGFNLQNWAIVVVFLPFGDFQLQHRNKATMLQGLQQAAMERRACIKQLNLKALALHARTYPHQLFDPEQVLISVGLKNLPGRKNSTGSTN